MEGGGESSEGIVDKRSIFLVDSSLFVHEEVADDDDHDDDALIPISSKCTR